MINPDLFDSAHEMNQRALSINRVTAASKFYIEISVMPEHEDDAKDITSLEFLQVERRDEKGNLVGILANYLTENETWSWLDGFETALEIPIQALGLKRLSVRDGCKLMEHGVSLEDLPQIDEAYSSCRYKIDGKRCSALRASSVLGREEFLISLSRAAFHGTTTRDSENGKMVSFDYNIKD